MKDTKKELIKLGDKYLKERGFNAFSYHDMARQVGVKTAAIHYHFPFKKDLAIAIIQYNIAELEALKLKIKTQSESDKLRSLLDHFTDLQDDHQVCIQSALLNDWNTLEVDIQKELKRYNKEFLNLLQEILQSGLSKGAFKFNEPVRTQALLILTNLMSAVQLSRIHGKEDFWTVRNAILRAIRA